ncbi:MAG: response regulator transcription factor [Planctomycetota bacterium]
MGMVATEAPAVRVLLVDDHAMVRQALSERLEREPGLTVVGTASEGDEALEMAGETRPEVVCLDIDMPGRLCFDVARDLMATYDGLRVLFVSAFFHDSYIEDALRVRAHGYVTKGQSLGQIVHAVKEVAAGRMYFSDDVRDRLVVDSSGVRLGASSTTRLATLTQREREVLRYIARGLSKKDIAAMMGLSVKTIENHTANLMIKLKIHDRVELARFAIREGLAEA